jgi:hypothetical protein
MRFCFGNSKYIYLVELIGGTDSGQRISRKRLFKNLTFFLFTTHRITRPRVERESCSFRCAATVVPLSGSNRFCGAGRAVSGVPGACCPLEPVWRSLAAIVLPAGDRNLFFLLMEPKPQKLFFQDLHCFFSKTPHLQLIYWHIFGLHLVYSI